MYRVMKLLEVVLFVLFISITTLVVLGYFSISRLKIQEFESQISNITKKISVLNRFDWYMKSQLFTWQTGYVYISWYEILTGYIWEYFYDCRIKTWNYIFENSLNYTGLFCTFSGDNLIFYDYSLK